MTPVSSVPLATAWARSQPLRCTGAGTKSTSSAEPSTPATTPRTEWLIVSPVVNALDRMTVPSVSPSVISAAKPGRRGMLRSASLGSNGFLIAVPIRPSTIRRANPSMPSSSHEYDSPNSVRIDR